MKTNEEIIEEFLSHFPTKEQVIKNFESDGTSTWNFTEHFKSVLLEALQAKDKEWIRLLKEMHTTIFDLYAEYGELDDETDEGLKNIGYKRLEDGKIVRT